jgi:hypothetical protein
LDLQHSAFSVLSVKAAPGRGKFGADISCRKHGIAWLIGGEGGRTPVSKCNLHSVYQPNEIGATPDRFFSLKMRINA